MSAVYFFKILTFKNLTYIPKFIFTVLFVKKTLYLFITMYRNASKQLTTHLRILSKHLKLQNQRKTFSSGKSTLLNA